jgi:hypothetical protein
MIRRPVADAEGRAHWALVSQVDHARLAGELAAAWRDRPLAGIGDDGEVLGAILCHDDGWAEWERRPDVDAESGRPLDFTEMPLADSLAIWRSSIETAAAHGDLGPYMVSGHFCTLLRRAVAARQKAAARWKEMAGGFLEEQESRQASWLAAWVAVDPKRSKAAADRPRPGSRGSTLSACGCAARSGQSPFALGRPAGRELALCQRGPRLSSSSLGPWRRTAWTFPRQPDASQSPNTETERRLRPPKDERYTCRGDFGRRA